MTADESAKVPTYIAQCPECDCLIACAVADVNNAPAMRDAVKFHGQWVRAGYKVSTVTVHNVRTWPKGKAFTHSEGCSRDKRAKRKKATQASLL